MTRYIIKRLLQGIIALILSSIIIFILLRLTGDPTALLLTPEATLDDIAALRTQLGLDKPYPVQYLLFMRDVITLDFGDSLFYRRPVFDLIMSRFPATLQLAITANVVSLFIAVPFGVIAATHREKWQDTAAKAIAIIGQSAPIFWVGIVLIQIFSVVLGWLPSSGYGGIQFLILPCIALGFNSVAAVLRLTRSSMLDVLSSDFVRLAKIKGLSDRLVIWKHALRNSLIPVVTFAAIHFVRTLAGSVVVETIFAWPGVGRLAYEAVLRRDFPVEQGILIMFTAIFILFNLLVDIFYLFLDPRVKLK
jgi:ABC-type dipeptide/oligopeptide/nickel transport system permease component